MNKIRLATPMGENDRHSSPIGQLNLCQNQVLSILSELDTSLNVRILRLLLERLNQLSYRSKYLSGQNQYKKYSITLMLESAIENSENSCLNLIFK
jgi:hypothetical protein